MTLHDQHKIPGPAHDGARVLWRHWMSPRAPQDGWIREFSADGAMVRVSATQKATDAGTWYRAIELRIESVLEPARAPVVAERKRRDETDSSEDLGE